LSFLLIICVVERRVLKAKPYLVNNSCKLVAIVYQTGFERTLLPRSNKLRRGTTPEFPSASIQVSPHKNVSAIILVYFALKVNEIFQRLDFYKK